MAAELRFAPTSTGPVAYRVDGTGSRWVLLIGDQQEPYGAPGEGAYDRFVEGVGEAGWRVLTILDGIGPGATGRRAGTDGRATAMRAAADVESVGSAVVVGVASGADAAALASAAQPSWAGRLILYGAFPESQDADPDVPAHPAAVARHRPEASQAELQRQLRAAAESVELARNLWTSWRRFVPARPGQLPGAPAGRDADSQAPVAMPPGPEGGPFLPLAEDVIDKLGALVNRPGEMEGGLSALMERLELLGANDGGNALGTISVPTIVAEVTAPSGTSSAGMELAARIPGARYRFIVDEPMLPWANGRPSAAFLGLLADGQPTIAPEGADREATERDRVLATVLFTYIVASTERLAELGDAAWASLLQRHHEIVRAELARFGGREVDNAGDGFLASFDSPAPGIRCAIEAISGIAAIGLAIRCGLHTGECERIGGKLGGIAVHIGARIAALAGAGEILVSGTVRELVAGSGIEFAARGDAQLKGVPGRWPIFLVVAADGAARDDRQSAVTDERPA